MTEHVVQSISYFVAGVFVLWLVGSVVAGIQHSAFENGEFRRAIGVSRFWSDFGLRGEAVEASALEYLGYFRSARALQKKSPRPIYPESCNARMCLEISAGDYQAVMREAEQVGVWPARDETVGAEWDLNRVNASEALYNLGRWDEAEAVMDGLTPAPRMFPIVAAGSINQRCWIFCHVGRGSDAFELHKSAVREDLPPLFFAEHHFTRALILLELKRFDESAAELDTAESVARRVTSKRNLIYMRARLAMARGDLDAAEALYRLGARHRYKGQGGEALLAWGDCLSKLSRPDDARTAWELCIRRDPQSASASTARDRCADLLVQNTRYT